MNAALVIAAYAGGCVTLAVMLGRLAQRVATLEAQLADEQAARQELVNAVIELRAAPGVDGGGP